MAAIGVERWQWGQCRRLSRTVPLVRARSISASETPESMRTRKRRFGSSGSSTATQRVFSPMTQAGASGTSQSHSGQRVSWQ
jgi:hypothetical protein